MTTTAPRRQAEEHNEFKHGPGWAAVNASLVTLCATTVGKFVGLPPWLALVVAATTAAAIIVAGRNRRPRALARGSLVFRSTAMSLCGLWMWWQLATFTDPGLSTAQLVMLLAGWPVTIALTLVAVAAPRMPGLIRIALPGLVGLFTTVLTLVLLSDVTAWLHDALLVTDRLAWGSGQLDVNMTWLATSVLSIVVIACPLAILGRVYINRERNADDELADRERAAVPARAGHQARTMLKLICDTTGEYKDLTNYNERGAVRVKVPALAIDDVTFWDNGAGETYVVNLVDVKNTTVEVLRNHTNLWATKLNLPAGCGIEVLGGDSEPDREYGRGVALVKVNRKNVLKAIIPYPTLKPRTIMNMFPIGVTRDGTPIGPLMRESSVFMVGQKGSGKTVTLQDLVAGLLQCTDVLVWGVDLNGGAAFAPFLRAWSEGKTSRPCIDWVATTTSEVKAMAQVALDIAVDRKIYYRDLKYKHDTNLMPVGNGEPGQPPPQIVILLDEGAEVMGLGGSSNPEHAEAKEALEGIMKLARDAAVNIVFCGLRATQDVASGAFKTGTEVRIGMRVSETAELAYLFNNNYGLNPAEIPYKGTGFICTGHDQKEIQVFKAYYLGPKEMYQIGYETTPWQPYMDDRGLKVAGRRYATRWQRTACYLFSDSPRLEQMSGYGGGVLTAEKGADEENPTGVTPSSGIRTRFFTPPTPGDFSDLMKAAEASRAQMGLGPLPDADEGDAPVPAPAPRREPVPAVPDDDDLDDDDLDDDEIQAKMDLQFNELVRRIQEQQAGGPPVDPADPSNRVPVTPEAEEDANPRSREILEKLVRARGPLGWKQMNALLNQGGDWGPPVRMSEQGMRGLLRKKGSKEPADWLVPRGQRDPYQHRDNI
jgi:hypothetical protein